MGSMLTRKYSRKLCRIVCLQECTSVNVLYTAGLLEFTKNGFIKKTVNNIALALRFAECDDKSYPILNGFINVLDIRCIKSANEEIRRYDI